VLGEIAAPDVGISQPWCRTYSSLGDRAKESRRERRHWQRAVGSAEGRVVMARCGYCNKGNRDARGGKVFTPARLAGPIRASEINRAGQGKADQILQFSEGHIAAAPN